MSNDAIVASFEFKPKKTKENFKPVETQAKKTGKNAGENFSQSFSRHAKTGFSNMSKNMLGAAAGLFAFSKAAGFINDATKAAIGFEQSIVEINTILPKNTKLTDQQTQALRNYAKQFGTSATAQAKSFYSIISAGITDTSKANKLLASANKLAIGGLSDVGSSIDILTTILNGYGAENITAAEAADSLFKTVQLGKTDVSQLSSALGAVIPSARAAGVSLDTANAAIATLTANGNTTSAAVTKLNALLGAMAKNGSKLGDGMDLAAIESDGFITVLQRLEKATGGSSAKLFELLGRGEAVQAAQILMRNSASALADTYAQFGSKLGAAETAYKTMGETAGQQLKQMNADIEDLKLSIGNGLTPMLMSLVSRMKTVKEHFSDGDSNVGEQYSTEIDKMTLSLADLHAKSKQMKDELKSGSHGLIRGLYLPSKIKESDAAIQEMTMNLGALKRQKDAFQQGTEDAASLVTLRGAQGEYQAHLMNVEAIRLKKEEERIANEARIAQIIALGLAQEQQLLATQTSQQLFTESSQENIEKMINFLSLGGKRVTKIAGEIGNAVFTSISSGVGRAFENVGKALANGENAFQAFADGLKNVLADVASSIGDVFIKWGVANLVSGNVGMGSAQIAAGAGLKLLSGFLGASGGGGGGSASGSASTTTEPVTVDDSSVSQVQETSQAEERVNLQLTVEGSFVRESEVNGYLTDLLETGSSEDATVIPSLKTGF